MNNEINTEINVTKGTLKEYVERIERLTNDKKAIAEDIKEIYEEAKSKGFDVKIMKMAIKVKNMKPKDKNNITKGLLDNYLLNLGIE